MNTSAYLLSVAALSLSVTLSAKQKPNVILIFADDLGYGDLGCYGNTVHRTPTFDRMANEGMQLNSFYVGSSVSTPSRAALLTGCYPKRISMHVNADPSPIMGKSRQVLFPVSMKGLNPNEITIAEILQKEGYRTACIGKWHLGDQLAFLPTQQGFEYYYGIPYSHDMGSEKCLLPLMEQDKVIEAPVSFDSLTIKYTRKVQSYIKEHKKEPFFIYLAHSMTHKPLDASPAFKGKSKNGLYGDAVEELDWSVDEILSTLKETGTDRNTLIIFTSDNGAAKGAGGGNLPLRDWKGSVYEGGFRVPCILYWPGVIPPEQKSPAIVTAMDLLPTITAYCGGKTPADRILDGCNISDILEHKKADQSPRVFYYYQRNQLQAVRWGKWKYHLPLKERIAGPSSDVLKEGTEQLYDLDTDISESTNIISKHPEVVKKIEDLITQARKDMGDWKHEGHNIRPAGIIDEPFPRQLDK